METRRPRPPESPLQDFWLDSIAALRTNHRSLTILPEFPNWRIIAVAKPINEQLDVLFDEWETQIKRDHPKAFFSRDGVVEERLWNEAPLKILFLLKERNLESKYTKKISWEQRQDLRRDARQGLWTELGQWSYAIFNHQTQPAYEEATRIESLERAYRSTALVNLTKMAGGASSSATTVWNSALQYERFLKKQVSIIDPNVVVCCGKGWVWDLAQRIFQDAAAASQIFKMDHKSRQVQGACYKGNKAFWIDFVHPSMRVSRRAKYECLLSLIASCGEDFPQIAKDPINRADFGQLNGIPPSL